MATSSMAENFAIRAVDEVKHFVVAALRDGERRIK